MALLRTWLNDERQALVSWLMRQCFWSSKEVGEAWEELRRDLDTLEKQYWALVDELERKKFYAARRIWPMRVQITPALMNNQKRDYKNWAEWFEQMFGENLEAYAKRAAEQNLREQVMNYELAEFGNSPLKKNDAA